MKPRLEILDDFLAEAEGLRRDYTVDPTIYRRWWADSDRTRIDVFAVDSVGRLVVTVHNTVTDPNGAPWLTVTHHEADRVALVLQAAGVLRYPADHDGGEVERTQAAEVERLRAKLAKDYEELRDKRTDLLNIRGILKPAPGVGDPVVPMPLGHEVAPAVEWLAGEAERLRGQRDRARMAVDRVSRLFDSDAIDETGLSPDAVSDAIADVDQLCPGCWRIHGTWCHPYGGPIADPDPTSLKRDLDGEEAKTTPENTAREDIERD